ncbi:hypothetical protein SDC9_171084 [bioreactor metagenome]|uniref:Uncharacterized protein n=1 Tax=bioreactor metagenome TaxID=1076179 RepID=A0A645G9W2_9ZZZZ
MNNSIKNAQILFPNTINGPVNVSLIASGKLVYGVKAIKLRIMIKTSAVPPKGITDRNGFATLGGTESGILMVISL